MSLKAKAKDLTFKAKAKAKDSKFVLEDSSRPTTKAKDNNTAYRSFGSVHDIVWENTVANGLAKKQNDGMPANQITYTSLNLIS